MNANFTGASNMMESQGLRSCLIIMEGDDSLGSIKVFVRDMNNKSWPILQKYGFDLETGRFDPGHFYENKNYEYIENGEKHVIKQPFHGLLTHLKHWLNNILDIEDDNQRVREWEKFLYHLIGVHDNCHHGELEIDTLWPFGIEHPVLYMKLTEFVTNEPYLIAKMFTMNTTQRCESFNAELGSAIPKTFTNYHYNLGVYSTIIKHNEPNFYNDFLEVTDAHKPLDKCRNRITHYYDLRKEFNVKRRTPEMRKRKNCFEYPINFIIVGFLAHIMISSSRSLIYFFALRHLRNLLL